MAEVIAWMPARQRPKGFAALEKYTAPTGYVNYFADDDSDRIASAYRPSFDRLVEVQQRYDPDNLFRLNHPS